jgi:hypothetical protein
MFDGNGPPLVLEGDNFLYWKICIEAYLEKIDIVIFRVATQGLPKPKNPTNLSVVRYITRNGTQMLKHPL